MRFDNIGLFWEDVPLERGGPRVNVMPPIPDTGWTAPCEFPNLSRARTISLDCETWDPEFETHGPGWARGKGHIVGVSIGADGGGRWYFPMRHEIEPETNMDPAKVLAWLRVTLSNRFQPKVGANLIYDIGWLKQEGVEVAGELVDVQFAESLLSERARVSLDILGLKYLGEGKESNVLYQWLSDYYGGTLGGKQRKNIYRAPARLVGPYAESDADLPLRLAPILYKLMLQENLVDLFRLECALIPLTVAMRFKGVRIDLNKAEQLQEILSIREQEVQAKLDRTVGFQVETTKPDSIAKAFDSMGFTYNRTATGQPSFTKKFLENVKNPVTDAINDIRKLRKLRGTFIESYILGAHINGRIFCQFHPLRGDEGGTRSGRWSSSTPNLQNIPARDEELAPLIRGLFLPDEGHKQWRKYDYSQIEYRFLIHYAVGPGADEARSKFINDPNTDYHDYTMDLVIPYAGWDVSTPEKRKHKRRPIKNINFGLVYGMGEGKLAGDLGLTRKEGKSLFGAYHTALPFVKATMEESSNEIQNTGFITTILGRRSRFDLWEPEGYGRDDIPLPYEAAVSTYGWNLKRSGAHKAINRRLQGSSADLIKKAMLDAWNAGIFDYIGVPPLTVHDELDFSDAGGKEDGWEALHHTLEHAIPLRIPVKAECEVGPDWGHVK